MLFTSAHDRITHRFLDERGRVLGTTHQGLGPFEVLRTEVSFDLARGEVVFEHIVRKVD